MKSQILSRSCTQLENEIQILKSAGGKQALPDFSSGCACQRVGKIN